MKTRTTFILATMIIIVAGLVSCAKDPDVPTGKVFNAISGGSDGEGGEVIGLKVTTYIVTTIGTLTYGGGNVTNDGNIVVTECGVCWGTSHNPTINDAHAASGSNEGNFVVEMTGLVADTTYYVRAYAKCSSGIVYGNEVDYVAPQQEDVFTVRVSANPSDGGQLSGGGTYRKGQSCQVKAQASDGYYFVNWTEDDIEVSFTSNYTFTVSDDRTLVANFMQYQSCTIDVSSNPSNGGTVSGGGTFLQGQSCTVTAQANSGYTFVNWTEDGNVVSTNASYTFTVYENRSLVANFSIPQGAINGVFSVQSNRRVYFSQGNLQYIGSSAIPFWKFADNQWDYFGANQSGTSQVINRDLFGWGTSGYDHGATCYQPWSTSKEDKDYRPYGQMYSNLGDQTGQADWGYNAIYNGGNQENQWRTLTKDEWNYVFNTRNTASGIRWAKGTVNGIGGVILLPDNWMGTEYVLDSVNDGSYNSNYITVEDWVNSFEANGAVFLPTSGIRYVTSGAGFEAQGYYWSASYKDSYFTYCIGFDNSNLFTQMQHNRHYGLSVRLVCPVK